MNWMRFLILAGVVAVLGCLGGNKGERVNAPEVSPKEAVKQKLESIVQTGQGGSAVGAIRKDLEKLRETDPAIAEELTKESSGLMMPGISPDDVKAKAKAMLQKLEGASGG